MRITTFIIATVVAALFITAFGLILADANSNYDLSNNGYTTTELEVFETLNETHQISERIQSRVTNQTADRSLTDVIGGFYADAKDTLLIATSSYDTFDTMSRAGMEKAGVPAPFKLAFFTIILVILFIGVILAAMVGRRL